MWQARGTKDLHRVLMQEPEGDRPSYYMKCYVKKVDIFLVCFQCQCDTNFVMTTLHILCLKSGCP